MAEITLNTAIRTNLLNLAQTQNLIDRTQGRLSTGLRVASPIDDSKAYFEAKGLNDRAQDFRDKKDGIDQAVSSVSGALNAIDAVDAMVRQLKGLAISAKSASGTELASIVTQYNEIRTQIDNLAADTEYQGINLVNGTGETLTVSFGNLSGSVLNVNAVDIRVAASGLNITAAAGFSATSTVDASITELDNAITSLRGHASTLGSNVALLQTRLDFTAAYVNDLEGGAAKLTLADINEEGANLVSLQTRQQLGISALAFAGQAEQSVLALFR
ncbi:MAG: flagellin [Alphaproteobacteria bacterium]